MPTMEQIEEGYFNYLSNEVLEAIMKANRYDCKDFTAIKLCFYKNMFNLLKNKEEFDKYMQVLGEYNQEQKILKLYDRNKK